MTTNPTAMPPAPQGPAQAPVGLDVQEIMDAYARECAGITQRALVAEAALRHVQAELAEARQTIESLTPRGNTEQEG